MSIETPLTPLIDQLKKLPGIGEKSAQRLAFFFLSLPVESVQSFANVLCHTKQTIRYCDQCYNISTTPLCGICTDHSRSADTLCVVADPRDIYAIERTQSFRGKYHVLGGLLSPIEGITPDILRISELMNRIQAHAPKEIILAINPTIEGEATILYIQEIMQRYPAVTVTKLAYGLPIGSDMDYADDMTLQRAFSGRRRINDTIE